MAFQDKLNVQFQVEKISDLFSNLSLWFDGHTGELTMTDLKKLVTSHGAHMTKSKLEDIRTPIVKPEWIYDSIKQRKLLDYRQYLLKQPPKLNFKKEEIWKCTHPQFIEKYFESSRLHFLSTWKQELNQFVSQEHLKRNKRRTNAQHPLIMHVDLDCFFASVVLRDKPELQDKPVVVAHSQQEDMSLDKMLESTSEIACANYPARQLGIKNGSFLGRARELCPTLIVMPYDYEAFDRCSKIFYSILLDEADFVQSVSCDEAYIDVSHACKEDPVAWAHQLRQKIYDSIKCTCSVGIGSSMLVSRVATKKAKPNNAFHIQDAEIPVYFQDLELKELPGVGYHILDKLKEHKLETCGQILNFQLQTLQNIVGQKTGSKIFDYCRGKDDRVIENKPRQNVGAEINWGIRFENMLQINTFMERFAEHIFNRMVQHEFTGRHLTVKAKKRDYEGEAYKFMGCGKCTDYSKSIVLPSHLKSKQQLYKESWNLLQTFAILPQDLRGIGIHIKRESLDPLQPGLEQFMNAPKRTPKTKRTENKLKLTPRKLFKQRYGIDPTEIDPTTIQHLPSDIQEDMRLLFPFEPTKESVDIPDWVQEDYLLTNEPILNGQVDPASDNHP
ncbi:hypothetical protein EDD86DRAFT_249720 [Gorgonomyces haynaldii]|nr:hypothetical protein EDD86DRAFT_249720 [Gorgonomyces haynaldii]